MTPKITVYISSRNYGEFLIDAIESVFRQSRGDWELLLFDDGSTDRTAEIIQRYAGHERVRALRTEGVGLPAICNLALREARGEYFIRLDGDDVFDEHALLVLANTLDRSPDVGLVFPDYYLVDAFGEIYVQERRMKLGQRNHVGDAPPNGACTMIRTALARTAGGFREDLGAQDGFDIAQKINRTHKCANVNLPLFYYRRHEQNLTNNVRRILAARRQITRDGVAGVLANARPFVAVIPCRKHFDFIPNLWAERLNGSTLLECAIETCLASNLLDAIIIAADTPDVDAVIARYRDPRLQSFLRASEDTTPSKPLAVTLEKVVRVHDPNLRGTTTAVYVQTPFRTVETIEASITTLIANDADSSFSVEVVRDALYRRAPHGLESLNPPRGISTDFDTVFRATDVALATRNRHLPTGSITGPRAVHFPVTNEEAYFIDSSLTLEIARQMESFIHAQQRGVVLPVVGVPAR